MFRLNLLWQIIMVVVNLLIFFGILQIWWGDTSSPLPNRLKKVDEKLTGLPCRDSQPLSSYEIVAKKNLFSAHRNAVSKGFGQDQNTDLDKNILRGIVVVGQGRVALVSSRDPQPGNPVEIIRPGDIWHGYKVLEIGPDRVIFESKEGKKIMNFPESKAKEGIVKLK